MLKSKQKLGFFCHFLTFSSLIFFEIAYNDTLQQWLISSLGKTHKKILLIKFVPKSAKIWTKFFFFLFLKFCLLVFLEIAYNDSFQQYLTSSRAKICKFTDLYQRDQNQATINYKYLRLTLVFLWNSAQWDKFDFCFSRVFC